MADDVCTTPNAWLRGAVAVWLRRLGSPRLMGGEVAEPHRLLLDGDPVGAAHAWTRLGCPYEAALALADAPDEEALREALGIVIGLEAQPAARIIRQRLRAVGARSIPAGPAHSDAEAAVRADPARVRGSRPDLRRADKRGDRREAVYLGQDRRPPRFGGPREAGRADSDRRAARCPAPPGGRGRTPPARAIRETVTMDH